MKQSLFLLLLASTFWGCEKNTTKPIVDHSSKYIQLAVGNTWVYQMDSIVYLGRGAVAPDTFRYEVKTEIVGLSEGTPLTYTVERYTRKNQLNPWKLQRVYVERMNNSNLERVVNNEIEIALSLPVTEEYLWDGNLYNTKDEIDYTYIDVHEPYSISPMSFDSTITVDQELVNNAVNRTIGKTVYAAHLGMIYQQYESLRNVETSDPVGSKFELKLISFEN